MTRNLLIGLFGVSLFLFPLGQGFAQQVEPDALVRLKEALAADEPEKIIGLYPLVLKQNERNLKRQVSINYLMASYFASKGAYNLAAEYQEKLYQCQVKMYPRFHFDTFCSLGAIAGYYLYADNVKEASKYYELALNYAHKYSDTYSLGAAYNNRGYFNQQIKKYDEALKDYRNALTFLETIDVKPAAHFLIGLVHGNMATIYAARNQREEATRHFEINLRNSKDFHDYNSYYWTLLKYSQELIKWGQTEQAKAYLKQIPDTVNGSSVFDKRLANTLILYELKKHDQKRFNWYLNHLTYTDSLDERSRLDLQRITSEAINQRFELVNAGLEKEKDKAVIRNQTFLLLIITLIGIGAVIIMQYNRRLRRKQQLIHTQNLHTQLIEKELENKQLREEQLSFQLKAKTTDVTTLSLSINDKIDWQARWLDDLKRIARLKDPDSAKNSLAELIGEIEVNSRIDKQQKPIIEQTAGTGTVFNERIKALYPDLTRKEIEICQLLRQQLSTKEIAARKGINTESAKMAKHRLRKKMGLGVDDDIYKVMSDI